MLRSHCACSHPRHLSDSKEGGFAKRPPPKSCGFDRTTMAVVCRHGFGVLSCNTRKYQRLGQPASPACVTLPVCRSLDAPSLNNKPLSCPVRSGAINSKHIDLTQVLLTALKSWHACSAEMSKLNRYSSPSQVTASTEVNHA